MEGANVCRQSLERVLPPYKACDDSFQFISVVLEALEDLGSHCILWRSHLSLPFRSLRIWPFPGFILNQANDMARTTI